MQPVDPEAVVHRALNRLPLPRAPRTLLPRVLAAARALAERPWYTRAWLTWPIAWQAASVAALVLLVALGVRMAPLADTTLRGAAAAVPGDGVAPLVDAARRIDSAARSAAAVADAIWVAWRAVMLPGVIYGFGLLGLMCAVCTAFFATLSRLAFGKALSR